MTNPFPQPTIIKGLGYTAAEAQLLTVPPYALATILTVAASILSQRIQFRSPIIIASISLAILGYVLLLSDPRPGVSYLGTIFAASGIYPAVALVLSWPASNVSGQTKRAVSNALQISVGNLGAVIGTQLYRTENSPRYLVGHGVAMAYLFMNGVVVSTLWFILKRENTRRDRIAEEMAQREVMGQSGDFIGDQDLRWRFQY